MQYRFSVNQNTRIKWQTVRTHHSFVQPFSYRVLSRRAEHGCSSGCFLPLHLPMSPAELCLPSFPWNSFPKQYVPSSPLILKSLVVPLFWTETYFQVVSVAEQLSLCIPLKCDTAVTHLACSWHQGPGLACWSFWEKTWKLAAVMMTACIKQGIWCSASSYRIR